MNIAFSMLSEGGNVIDRLQAMGSAKEQLGDPDYWGSVGILTITGILVVFFILAILIFFFWLMGSIFKAIDKSKTAKKSVSAESAAVVSATVAQPDVEEVNGTDEDEEEIVAVISAAIAAYAEADGTTYTIKSIKKHSDNRARSAWSLAGIRGNMRQF